jgi:tetratricopeptide (TPR) repeat protein
MWKADELFARGKALYNQNDLGSAIETLQQAASLFPDPSYHDELSYTAAKGALALFEAGESTAAAELATYAINESNITISMNSVHTNFYKTRARVFLILAQMTPNYYNNAITALREVQALSPTDPKIPYNLALIAQQQGKDEEYKLQLEKVLQLRPVDEPARYAYGQVLEEQGEFAKAKENYEYMLQFINPENTLVKDRLASISGKLQK